MEYAAQGRVKLRRDRAECCLRKPRAAVGRGAFV
jgi:hypothetical protein